MGTRSRTPHRIARAFIAAAALCLAAPAALGAAEPPADPQLVLDPGFHTAMIRRVSASEDGSRLLSASDDKTARLYDGEGRLLRVLRVPISSGNEGKLYACALSPDGKLAAVGGWTGYDFETAKCIYIFDADTGTLLRRIGGLPNVVNHLAFSGSAAGRLLLAASFGSNGIRAFDPLTCTEVFRDAAYGSDSYSCDFSPDGTFLAAVSYDGSVRAYPRSGSGYGSALKVVGRGGTKPFSLSFCTSGSKLLLAVGYRDALAVDVFELKASGLSYAYSPDFTGLSGGYVASVEFGKGREPRLLAGGTTWKDGEYNVLVWESAGRGARRELKLGFKNTISDIRGLSDGGFLVAGAEPALVRIGADLDARFSFLRQTADFNGNLEGFRISGDGMTFDFSYTLFGKDPASFSLSSRSIGTPVALPPQDTSSLKLTDWRSTYQPKLDGNSLKLEDYEYSCSLAVAPDAQSFLLGTTWNIRRFSAEGKPLWSVPAPEVAWAVAVSGDGRLAAAAYDNGTIHWYRYDTGQELLTFFPHPDRKRWVAWTPSGYYDASLGAEELIGWHLNRGLDKAPDYFPASRFRSTYYRPDVVALVLPALSEKTALAMADEAAGRRTQAADILSKLPPTVSIVSPASGSPFTGSMVRLTYRVSAPADAPATGVRALVDGRPAEGAKGLAVVAKDGADPVIEVAVPDRSCSVSLIADNRNGPSEAATVQLVRAAAAAPTAAEAFEIKPKLYVLAVGVSSYDNADYRLAYAAKDARDIAAAFARQKGGIFRDAELRVLADKDASKDNILDGLEWIQKQTTAKDVAVMFFSGHGLNDATQNYYYLPVGVDLDRLKRTGVPFTDITTTVSAIAGKVLFFIDTCHSGNLMKGRKAVGVERDIAATVNELASAENGAVVFASSTGSQYSYEDPAWGNGAFTKAIVEGLSGQAAYGASPRITVNMLDLYLSERVKALTGGKQTPTTTKPANVPDFPLAMK
jgi:WD40 repeat protein